jgi:hypothetical protein
MIVKEIVTDRETAEVLSAFAQPGGEAVLLGREIGGAVVVTGAVPVPTGEEGWERLRALRHGPVGALLTGGGLPAPGAPFLPGDVVVLAAPGSEPSTWTCHALAWEGPADRGHWDPVGFSCPG